MASNKPPAPPNIDYGTRIVKIFVGPNDRAREFVIHRDPICASSKFFEKAFGGSFLEGQSQEVKLPEEEHQIFAFFCDWLYTGFVSTNNRGYVAARQLWTGDTFWLKVYRMADRILSAGLQALAYERITTFFSVLDPVIPSHEFIIDLFTEESPLAMQMHVVEHIAYWLPNSQNKEDWGRLFSLHERFGMEMALAMIRSQSKTSDFLHPGQQAGFAEKHGFDLSELSAQARSGDEPINDATLKEMDRADLIVDPDPTTSGFKPPTSKLLTLDATPTLAPARASTTVVPSVPQLNTQTGPVLESTTSNTSTTSQATIPPALDFTPLDFFAAGRGRRRGAGRPRGN